MIINQNSTLEDICQIRDSDIERAMYWFEKKIGHSAEDEFWYLEQASMRELFKPNHYSEVVTYEPECGNKWVIFVQAVTINGYLSSSINRLIYYQTEHSIGTFALVKNPHGEQTYMVSLTPHFFQRWCEHGLGTMDGVNTIADFWHDNPEMMINPIRIHDREDGSQEVYMYIKGGAAVLKQSSEHPEFFIAKTCLSEEIMFSKQHELYETAKDDQETFIEKLKCQRRKEIKDAEKEEAKETIEMIVDNNKQKNQDSMNKQAQAAFQRVLKDSGLKNFKTLVLTMGYTKPYERYIEEIEPVYAITRTQAYANTERDAERVKKANKVWLEIVINNDWATPFNEYTQKYGKPNVIAAVKYLINNDLWDTKKGTEAIRTRPDDYFSGLEAINEAMEHLIETEPDKYQLPANQTVTEPEKQEESNPSVVADKGLLDFGEPEEYDPSLITAPRALNEARKAKDMVNHLIDSVDKLIDYVAVTADDTKRIEEINKYKKEAADAKQKLTQANALATTQKEKIIKLQKDYDEAQERYVSKSETLKTTQAENTKLSSANKTLEAANQKLAREYNELKEAHDKLKEAAQNELPRCKVIPMSKLSGLPLMGPKLLSILVPFLKNYNVIVDDKH